MRVAIVTDAWYPQTNGVVHTLTQTVNCLQRFGHTIEMLTPDQFRTVPCPTYPEIRLALFARRQVARRIEASSPDALHIATEGPLGIAARSYCVRARWRFTTSYHTRFPEYLRARFPVPLALSYRAVRWFHGGAQHCMVSTASIQQELRSRGFRNIVRWRRGVDTNLFRPRPKSFLDLPRPIAVYIGRVAVEKNIEAFLGMPWRGSKLVVGDGPERSRLQARFPDVHYAGYRFGEDLAAHLAAADVMVFPSLTDTFGLVNLEALACGVPVAAFPVSGPVDVIEEGVTGSLDWDLPAAAERALRIDPAVCRERALGWSWERCTREFEGNLVACGGAPLSAPQGALPLST